MLSLVNPLTESALKAYSSRPVGALIISGSRYAGTDSVIEMLRTHLLDTHKLNTLHIQPENNSTIGVEKIRELKQWLSTRFSKRAVIARMIVIHESECMTHEAQNALLKILEEPSEDTIIILKASEHIRLLDTIRSRCQVIKVLPVSVESALEAASKLGVDPVKARGAYALSGGEVALFEQLLVSSESDLTTHVAEAKEFLKLSQFDRLCLQPKYAEATQLSELIGALCRVCDAAMVQSTSQVEKWATLLRVAKYADKLIAQNTSPKLVFTYISVNL